MTNSSNSLTSARVSAATPVNATVQVVSATNPARLREGFEKAERATLPFRMIGELDDDVGIVGKIGKLENISADHMDRPDADYIVHAANDAVDAALAAGTATETEQE